jgi:hypothetical protein
MPRDAGQWNTSPRPFHESSRAEGPGRPTPTQGPHPGPHQAIGREAQGGAGWYAPSPVETPPGPHAWSRPDPASLGEEVMHIHPGPGTVNLPEEELRERMDAESPDGRPPSMHDSRQAKAIFFTGFILTTVVVLAVLWIWAGLLPMLVGLILGTFFIFFAAWPTWHAGLDRKLDKNRVKHEVLESPTGAPPPPAPPAERAVSGRPS